MIAFDTDVLIYAVDPSNTLGRRVAALFATDPAIQPQVGVGSTLLIPEALIKPVRHTIADEVMVLWSLLARLHLLPFDGATAIKAMALGAHYGLRAPDAVHLATAVQASADQFLTNNRKDFPKTILEIDIIYPNELPEP